MVRLATKVYHSAGICAANTAHQCWVSPFDARTARGLYPIYKNLIVPHVTAFPPPPRQCPLSVIRSSSAQGILKEEH